MRCHTGIRHRGGRDAAKRGEPAKALQMIHPGNQRLIPALREASQRPTVGIFTHVKPGIDQRNNVLHQLLIRRLRIQRIEGFASLLRREVFRDGFRGVGFGIRDHHQHRLDLALRQQVIHDLRNAP